MNSSKKFIGLGVSSGVVQGKAKIIRTDDDIKLVKTEEIIVTRDATPYILPALIASAGAVCERGGYTSHLAIMSREYMRPCVVGVVGALQNIRDGALLELNGASGVIRILDVE